MRAWAHARITATEKGDDNISSDEDSIAPDNEDKDARKNVENDNDEKDDNVDAVPNNDEDATNEKDKDDDEHVEPTNDDKDTDSDIDEDESYMPDDCVFEFYFACLAWGHFAPKNDRLKKLMTTYD